MPGCGAPLPPSGPRLARATTSCPCATQWHRLKQLSLPPDSSATVFIDDGLCVCLQSLRFLVRSRRRRGTEDQCQHTGPRHGWAICLAFYSSHSSVWSTQLGRLRESFKLGGVCVHILAVIHPSQRMGQTRRANPHPAPRAGDLFAKQMRRGTSPMDVRQASCSRSRIC